jgi:DNA-binding GntR family transcriptional regulator
MHRNGTAGWRIASPPDTQREDSRVPSQREGVADQAGRNGRAGSGVTVRLPDGPRILLGQVRPGHVIAAHSLAHEMAVSRTPVHEALKRLVGEGFLVARPRLGYAVTSIDMDELRDLFQVRTRLEAFAAELAARAWSPAHARAFALADAASQRRHRELLRTGEPAELSEFMHGEHKRFHRMIGEIGGNGRLQRLISDLQDEAQRFWSLLPTEELISKVFLADEAHASILRAIATGDPTAARAAIVTHMRDGVRAMVEAVVPDEPSPDEEGI